MVLITFTCPQSPVPGCDENPRGFLWQILNALGVTGKHHLRTLFSLLFSLKLFISSTQDRLRYQITPLCFTSLCKNAKALTTISFLSKPIFLKSLGVLIRK